MSDTGRVKPPGAGAVTFETPSGTLVSLSADEYRLALLALVDFEASGEPGRTDGWQGLEDATAFVRDGAAKLALIRHRVRPLAAHLAPLVQQIDTAELLVARYWFRSVPCTAPVAAAEEETS